MIIGFSTLSNRSNFKAIPASIPTGNIFIEARQATSPVDFTLKKDGVQVVSRRESGAPFDLMGGSTTAATAYNAQAGNYELTVKDAVGTIVTIFTVGTVTPPPVPGCTDPAANNYNSNATVDDGSCTYDPIPTKPEMIVSFNYNKDEVTLKVNINGEPKI